MFYAHFVLSKRGPLARIWLAAHWDKKLTKAHVFETNLEDSVETIISPQVKMALRTSGHLLLGVVRIYNRKAKYLLADCNEAFVKIKMAFRPGVVDLPAENIEAQHNQIYLPEEFHNFDTPLPDISDFDITQQLKANQSRIDEITMPEEVPSTRPDEGFGGGMMEFEKDVDGHYSADLQNMFYKDDDGQGKDAGKNFGFGDHDGMKDGFAPDMGDEGILGEGFMHGPGLFGEQQHGGLFGERSPKKQDEEIAMDTAEGAMDNQVMSPAPQQQLQIDESSKEGERLLLNEDQAPIEEPPLQPNVFNADQSSKIDVSAPLLVSTNADDMLPDIPLPPPPEVPAPPEETTKDQTTLVENEAEAFALEPLDITGVKDMRMRRKRKLIVDHVMELDGQTMREQLKDFNDIVTTLDMAPPTKRLMQWKEMGGVEKLFSLPIKKAGDDLDKLFVKNLHHEIPEDLLDITGTQLHEQYGEVEPEIVFPTNDESSIHEGRNLAQQSIPTPVEKLDSGMSNLVADASNITNQSVMFEQMKGNEDPQMNQVTAPDNYQSEDDYEPASVGPPSVGSSIGNNPEPSMVDDANQIFSAINPDIGDLIDPALPPSPGEGEAFADDLDDLRWNKRTQHLLHSLQRTFQHEREVSFFQMTDGITKKQAVSKFYSLLVLAKQEATLLQQGQIFGDVFIQKGPKFDSILM